MTFRSTLLSYAGIALASVGFGFSLMSPPSTFATDIYNDHLPTIGIDAGIQIDPSSFDSYKF